MKPEEARLRAVYLYLACVKIVDECQPGLIEAVPMSEQTSNVMLERGVRKELGMLFRHWASRVVWEGLEENEADATAVNLQLLHVFTHGFKLSKDGSGLRYAELSTPEEELKEFSHRISHVTGYGHKPLLDAIHAGFPGWRKRVHAHAADMLKSSVTQIEASVRAWVAHAPTGD